MSKEFSPASDPQSPAEEFAKLTANLSLCNEARRTEDQGPLDLPDFLKPTLELPDFLRRETATEAPKPVVDKERFDRAITVLKRRNETIENLTDKNFILKLGAGALAAALAVGLLTQSYTLREGKAIVGEDGDAAKAVCATAEQQVESLFFADEHSFNTEACITDLKGITLPQKTEVDVTTTITPLTGAGDGIHLRTLAVNVETGLDGIKVPESKP
ncbi:MAG: hypothetical protein Q4A37_00130 [Candidatus Saccharibacteria bacterium]|nr:hypothetical protein [Candidatus Saccharibacteria bacterium]